MITSISNPKFVVPGRPMRSWLLPAIVAATLSAGVLNGQQVLQSSPQYEEEAARLREFLTPYRQRFPQVAVEEVSSRGSASRRSS